MFSNAFAAALVAVLVAQQAVSTPVLGRRQLGIVDDITCSLIKERLNNPATIVGDLTRRSPAGDLDLSDILQSCSKSTSERFRKPHDFSFGDGEGSGNGNGDSRATGPVGGAYGQYPPYTASASPGTSASVSGNGVGSGSVPNSSSSSSGGAASGSGSGSGAQSSGAQTSNSVSSGSSNGAKVPFNPANAPNTITRRGESSPVTPPSAPNPAEVAPKPASPAVADIDEDAGFKRPKSSTHSAADDKPTHPGINDKDESKHDSRPTSKCVGQAGSFTCGLQALGL